LFTLTLLALTWRSLSGCLIPLSLLPLGLGALAFLRPWSPFLARLAGAVPL
jgi:hypothetical protein